MTPERWEQIKTTVKKSFAVEDEGTEDLLVDTAEGQVKQGAAEFLVFKSPLGRTKLQFQQKPKLEEKKFHYSHRQGNAARVEYKFSESEFVYTFKAYRWDEVSEEWKEIEAEGFTNY